MAVPTEESFPQLVRTTNSPSLFLPRQLSLLVAQQLRPEIPVSIAQYVDVDGPLDIELLTAASKQTGREIGSGYLAPGRGGRGVRVSGSISTWTTPSTWSIFAAESDPESAAQEWMRSEHTAAIDPFTDRLVRLAVLVLRDRPLLLVQPYSSCGARRFSARCR